jgi:oxygen-independent coproporphyrinogen-3 oxidase
VPSAPPDGQPAPDDGTLPPSVAEGAEDRLFGVYLHVPFCAQRCGYCDFNTYVDLGDLHGSWADSAIAELDLAAKVLGDRAPAVETVFVGGGTPTLLPPTSLGRVLRAIADRFGLAPGAEVTAEANPETVDPASLADLRAHGFTRMSFGMQSARAHVLAVLDRTHSPGRPEQCVRWAHDAGFEQVNLDLIHGAPGESLDDWRASLDAVVAAAPEHVSAYSLIVEPGTKLAAQIARGELAEPDEDTLADGYLLADDVLSQAGYTWYEISNWSHGPDARCRHNLGYWRDGDWWGVGPGAHSHAGGVRWWNVRHPRDWAARLAAGASPAEAREQLDGETRRVERLLLGVRLAGGHPAADLTETGRAAASAYADRGLLDAAALADGRLVLTRPGRLLADAVIRDLVD